jgi:glycerophosphoryl diester phosphodiesterase
VTRVIAHRGASRAWPDNTLAAFAAAKALGADGVELDVRPTADGQLAVVHDAHLPDGQPVAATPFAELPPGISSLSAALASCGETMLVNVEIKNDPAEPGFSLGLADLVASVLDGWAGPVIVSSFHLPTIDRLKAVQPSWRTGWLVMAPPTDWASIMEGQGHDALHPHHRAVTPHLADEARDRGFELNVWTVDDAARLIELVALGVDGIVTNVPDVARRVLGRG